MGDVPERFALADLFGSAFHAQMLFVLAFRDDLPSSNACVDSLQLQRLTAMGDTPAVMRLPLQVALLSLPDSVGATA